MPQRSARTGARLPVRPSGRHFGCLDRPGACSASSALPPVQRRSAVDEPNRLLCAERGDHPVRRVRPHHRQHNTRGPEPRRHPRRLDRGGPPPAGRSPRPARVPHLRRARRPPRDRRRAGRGRHRAHLRDPGADAAAGPGRRGRHRPGAHGHGQDPRLRRAAAAAGHPAGRAARRRRARRSRRPHQGRSPGPGRGAHPRAVRPGGQGPGRRRGASSASGSPRSTAAGPTSRSSPPCARASTWWSARPAACWTSPSSATSCSAASRRWSWTRPTRCWTSGFLPDVERIMRMLPEQRHTMLFSATMPGPIIALSRAFLNRPDAHPRRGGRPGLDPRAHHAAASTARTRWTRSSCSPACCRRRTAGSP